MGQMRCIFLVIIFSLGICVATYAQDPPPPDQKRHEEPPCDPGDGDGGGAGVPPPVGLCLPIDDYVYILMAAGVMYGCYKLRKFEFN